MTLAPWLRSDRVRMSILDMVICLAVLILVTAFFSFRIAQSIDLRVVNDAVLGADPQQRLQELTDHHLIGITKMHALAVAWAAVTIIPLQALGMNLKIVSSISCGLAVGLGAVFMFFTLRKIEVNRIGAVSLIALIFSSFSAITVFSVIETYSVTFAAICFGIIITLKFSAKVENPVRKTGIIVGIIFALAGTSNMPAAAYSMTSFGIFYDQKRKKNEILFGTMCAILTSGILIIIFVLAMKFFVNYTPKGLIQNYATVQHFYLNKYIRDLIPSLTSYMFVAPLNVIKCRYLFSDWTGYFERPLTLVAIFGCWTAIAAGTVQGIVNSSRRGIVLSNWMIIISFIIFYTYFYPQAIVLYTTQIMPSIAIIISPILTRFKKMWIPLAVLAVLCFTLNRPVLFQGNIDNINLACPHSRSAADGRF